MQSDLNEGSDFGSVGWILTTLTCRCWARFREVEVAGDWKLFVLNLVLCVFYVWMYVCANRMECAPCLRYPLREKPKFIIVIIVWTIFNFLKRYISWGLIDRFHWLNSCFLLIFLCAFEILKNYSWIHADNVLNLLVKISVHDNNLWFAELLWVLSSRQILRF